MILDLETDDLPASARFVVIGAGAVGLVLAVALARRGEHVVVLESGGRGFESAAQALNDAEVKGRAHRGIAEGRARVFGGTTTLWGGQLTRFLPIDLEPRPWLGLPGWPIAYSDIEPWYRQVAEMLGLDVDCLDDAAVWRGLRLDPPDLAPYHSSILTRWLKEPNLARLFERELRATPNLTVALHANCTGFEFTPAGTGVAAVSAQAPNGRRTQLATEHVILANGTIEAVRLMLACAQEGAPWAGNPWLGCGFQDHLDVSAGKVHVLDKRRFDDLAQNIVWRGFKYMPKLVATPAAQAAGEMTHIAASIVVESALGEHLAKLKIAARSILNGTRPKNLGGVLASALATMRVWLPLTLRYVRDNRVMQLADRGLHFALHCEQLPVRESRISLSTARQDAYGVPQAVLDWRVDGREVGGMKRFAEGLGRALEAKGIARLEIDPRLLAEDPAFLDSCEDTNHHCGGLRMAANPADGVVDADLKVHGCDNVHVAGAATFPTSSFANPTFTAMALALRLADRLAD